MPEGNGGAFIYFVLEDVERGCTRFHKTLMDLQLAAREAVKIQGGLIWVVLRVRVYVTGDVLRGQTSVSMDRIPGNLEIVMESRRQCRTGVVRKMLLLFPCKKTTHALAFFHCEALVEVRNLT